MPSVRTITPASFLSTLPVRGATTPVTLMFRASLFLSTLPARGATSAPLTLWGEFGVFLSTLPARGATPHRSRLRRCRGYFYPRSPRGERPRAPAHHAKAGLISIHAPREGSDPPRQAHPRLDPKFLSTLPARGATGRCAHCRGPVSYFYPRSPRGERLKASPLIPPPTDISIHAPREGSDSGHVIPPQNASEISIHAPREGSDLRPPPPSSSPSHFYPRSPRGERRRQSRSYWT